MTRTGDREIRSVSGRLPDNPGELARMRFCEKTANLHFLRGLLRFQPWFGHENGAIISFTNAARRDGANILWLLDFDWLLKSYDCLIFAFHWFISAG